MVGSRPIAQGSFVNQPDRKGARVRERSPKDEPNTRDAVYYPARRRQLAGSPPYKELQCEMSTLTKVFTARA